MITKHSFYRYLKCPSWIAHESREDHAQDILRTRLQEDGLLPEVERDILLRRGPVVDATDDDLEISMQKTIAFMHDGAQTIYGATLIYDKSVAQPDFLEKVEGKSRFGDYYYIACDIKRTKRIKNEYKMQGAFYADVLSMVQGTKPVQGYILRSSGEITAYIIQDIEVQYKLTFDAILRILEGAEEPHFLTSDCKQSPWFHVCKSDSRDCDDLSRINRIWRSEVTELKNAGFATLGDFATTHIDLIAPKVRGVTRDRLDLLHAQAQALHEYKVIRLSEVDLPPEEDFLIIDIESSPLRDVDYLFGILKVEHGSETFIPFLAKRPEEEGIAWRECVDFLADHQAMPIYYWGTAEVDIFESLTKKYATNPEIVSYIRAKGVDLLARIRERIIFPLSFYSLKDIAKFIGFSWRHEDASGLNSVLWFEKWMRQDDTKVLQDIVDYNEDDVRATLAVLRWVRQG